MVPAQNINDNPAITGDAVFKVKDAPMARNGDFGAAPSPFSKFMSIGSPGTMMHRLTPPMVIMQNQEQLGLTKKQIDLIKNEMKSFQSDIVDVQWDLNAAKTTLEKELDGEKIDLHAALQSMNKVLDAENRLKRQHLALLIKIHNVLTPEQQDQLETLKGMHFHGMHMGPPMNFSSGMPE